jgi:hypothetical protein
LIDISKTSTANFAPNQVFSQLYPSLIHCTARIDALQIFCKILASVAIMLENIDENAVIRQELTLRVTLAGNIDPDFATRLSTALGLPLVFPTDEKACQSGLPSDDAVIGSIIDTIIQHENSADKGKGYVLGGYPLNVVQAQSLDIALARSGQAVDTALMLETTDPLQYSEDKPLRRYYRSQNKLILFAESSAIDEICSSILQIHEKRRIQR